MGADTLKAEQDGRLCERQEGVEWVQPLPRGPPTLGRCLGNLPREPLPGLLVELSFHGGPGPAPRRAGLS